MADASENMVVNAGFDDDLEGWNVYGSHISWVADGLGCDDESGAVGIDVPALEPVSSAYLSQCLPASADAAYMAALEFEFEFVEDLTNAFFSIRSYDGADCAGSNLAWDVEKVSDLAVSGVPLVAQLELPAAPGVHSIHVRIEWLLGTIVPAANLRLDNVLLRPLDP